MGNGNQKPIEDVQYSDVLLSWDFDVGSFTNSTPLWIKVPQSAPSYNELVFDDGTVLHTIEPILGHRIFNIEAGAFTSSMDAATTSLGTSTFKVDGTTPSLTSRRIVQGDVEFYNVVTAYHMNIFANGILTSLRWNNVRKTENMRFVGEAVDKTDFSTVLENAGLPSNFVSGLRLGEHVDKSVFEIVQYVERMVALMSYSAAPL